MDGVCWSCMHVYCMCVSYTYIPCAGFIFLMTDYDCGMVSMDNLMLWNAFVMSM